VSTPVEPVPPDPDDPETWDWGEFADDRHRSKPFWQRVLVGIVVLGLVLLIITSIL
jgi:hypothetical protein